MVFFYFLPSGGASEQFGAGGELVLSRIRLNRLKTRLDFPSDQDTF
jgi:hypothetical protein